MIRISQCESPRIFRIYDKERTNWRSNFRIIIWEGFGIIQKLLLAGLETKIGILHPRGFGGQSGSGGCHPPSTPIGCDLLFSKRVIFHAPRTTCKRLTGPCICRVRFAVSGAVRIVQKSGHIVAVEVDSSYPSQDAKIEVPVTMRAAQHDHSHQAVPSDLTLRVKALESLLVEKGLVDPAALDALIDTYEHKIGPRNGARVVARAWVDPAYRERLLTDATAAIGELGYTGGQGEHMVVVANGPRVHNLVVCTLCSCYPWPVLGLPPVWYKSAPYRSRAVIDPRGVLREFGLELPQDVEIRVWDSTSEVRYLVLPERPAGSEKLSEEELTALVTRDAMVGVAKVKLQRPGANR
jgi:nitrile hydratase subunit alpha